jgi:hypothetical protein
LRVAREPSPFAFEVRETEARLAARRFFKIPFPCLLIDGTEIKKWPTSSIQSAGGSAQVGGQESLGLGREDEAQPYDKQARYW